eukprot:3219562-Pleurochrysis_carterae.AAC.1
MQTTVSGDTKAPPPPPFVPPPRSHDIASRTQTHHASRSCLTATKKQLPRRPRLSGSHQEAKPLLPSNDLQRIKVDTKKRSGRHQEATRKRPGSYRETTGKSSKKSYPPMRTKHVTT